MLSTEGWDCLGGEEGYWLEEKEGGGGGREGRGLYGRGGVRGMYE